MNLAHCSMPQCLNYKWNTQNFLQSPHIEHSNCADQVTVPDVTLLYAHCRVLVNQHRICSRPSPLLALGFCLVGQSLARCFKSWIGVWLVQCFNQFLHFGQRIVHLIHWKTRIIHLLNFQFLFEFLFSLFLQFSLFFIKFFIVLFVFGLSFKVGIELFIKLNFLTYIKLTWNEDNMLYSWKAWL